jgi:surface antigen
MNTLPDGQTHSWNNIDIAGSIRPDKSFVNKSGEKCRYFGEVLKVHAVQQNISGLACQNGSVSWCKLRANATPACGLGHKPGALDSISGAFDKLF